MDRGNGRCVYQKKRFIYYNCGVMFNEVTWCSGISAVANHFSPMLKCERSNIPPLLLRQKREVTGEAYLRVWMSHASRVLSTRKIPHMGGFRRTNKSELFAISTENNAKKLVVRIQLVSPFFFFVPTQSITRFSKSPPSILIFSEMLGVYIEVVGVIES